ncbi:hypothetical protein LCGC14_1065370 [marine sediment metagenome]|uniref:Uncharacterized protein n=1 Tax=marine sediment metagenome TaxID=412755 RepID=A0A0F9Q2T8_9ZZZZ
MEKFEIYFLERIKKVDPDFKKLYDEITNQKEQEEKNHKI